MSTPYILFFDTFNHEKVTCFDGERDPSKTNMETFDCVRFKSPINLLEVRIIPFGSVVESSLSDEAILGATNPALFDVVVYSNNQTNCITLHNIARYHFDEKIGINSITFKEPVHSNFLLFRGRYATMTVALFGIPAIPLSTHCLLPAGSGVAVPPPTAHSVGQIATPSTVGVFQRTAAQSHNSPSISPVQSSSLPVLVMQSHGNESQWPEGPSREQNEEATGQEQNQLNDGACVSQIQQHGSASTGATNTEVVANDDMLHLTSDLPGLYEDGEIQDIDYEEISSNEEIFSEPETGNADDNALLSETDERFASCFWRFNPWEMANSGRTGSNVRRERLPDPTSTLFQMHTWLLDRPIVDENLRDSDCNTVDKADSVSVVEEKTEELLGNETEWTPTNDGIETSQPQQQKGGTENTVELIASVVRAPPSDWTLAAAAGEWLQTLASKFNIDAELHDEWVQEMEGIEANLALGLAFLSLFQSEETFKNVCQCLLHWVRVGLDLSLALRQPNATYIVRHLTAGVRLAGLLVGTTSLGLAHILLRPECETDCTANGCYQVQHLLLDLLESPLVGTPLRLNICRALDQTTRLAMGLDAFLGRQCVEPTVVCPTHRVPAAQAAVGVEQEHPVTSAQESAEGEMADTKKEAKTVGLADGLQDADSKRTPYQRLVCFFVASKNSRVTTAYQRLVNKVHAYEMLLDFQDFVLQLRGSTVSTVEEQEVLATRLATFLRELTRLWSEAPWVIADPRNSLPCSILLDRSQSAYNDPYPTICCLFDRINLLDNLVWLTEQLPRKKLPTALQLKAMETDVKEEVEEGMSVDDTSAVKEGSRSHVWLSTDLIAPGLTRLISLLLAGPTGLGFLASRGEETSRLLSACLSLDIAYSPALIELAVCGLEMSCKLEIYNSLDVLVAWARKEGERPSDSLPESESEAALRRALFSLARLCVSGLGCPAVAGGPGDSCLTSVLTTSSPAWLAEVLVMDDFSAPLLMILEAAGKDSSPGDTVPTRYRSTEALTGVKSGASTECGTVSNSNLPAATSIRSTLKSLLQNPLEPAGLVNIIMTTVIRYSENMQYLDRYAPRLVQLVSAYSWEDCLEDSATIGFFSQLASFSEAASPYLGWLRDFPDLASRVPQPPSSLSILSLLQPTRSVGSVDQHISLLSSDAVPWLVAQLPVMCKQMEEALDALLDVDVSEELSAPPPVAPIGDRKSAGQSAITSTGIASGHGLPACLLLLLRLLRSHVIPDNDDVGLRGDQFGDHLINLHNYRQVFISDGLALIELYKANGLLLLSSLIQRLSDFLMLHYQVSATVAIPSCIFAPVTCCCCSSAGRQPSSMCHLDPAHVTNGVGGLALAMLDQAVQLVGVLLYAILVPTSADSQAPPASQFRDVSVARSLFKAYACTVYAQVSAGPHRTQMDRLRRSTINALMAFVNGGIGQSLTPKDVETSLWVEVLRDLVAFTVSSPTYYLPGLCIFLDLLPLPLPVVTASPIDPVSQQKLLTVRNLWAVHLLPVACELAGLIELLVATSLSPQTTGLSNALRHPVYAALNQLVIRLDDLSGCASLLTEACLCTVFAVCDNIYARVHKKATGATADKDEAKANEQPSACALDGPAVVAGCGQQPATGLQSVGPSATSLASTSPATTLIGSAASVRLLLQPQAASACGTAGDKEAADGVLVGVGGGSRSDPEETVVSGVGDKSRDLTGLAGSTEAVELAAVVALLRLHLGSPVCRLAIINLLRPTGSTDDIPGAKEHTQPSSVAGLRGRKRKFCSIISDILSVLSDQPAIVQIQLLVLECICLLLDSKRALFGQQPEETESAKCLLVKGGLPDVDLCRELVAALIKHIDHPDRDMATLPAALQPLLLLTEQDIGFHLVVEALQRSALVAPSGGGTSGQHFFASLLQRVNDCFSVENPACQATLAMCLRLLQSLLLLPTPSNARATTDSAGSGTGDHCSPAVLSLVPEELFDTKVVLRLRQHHLPVCNLRLFMGWWSTVGDEGKPVRDLHALLEMLADDEPSLEYLRTGMKNLLTLLSADFDAPQSGVEHLEKQLLASTVAINELAAVPNQHLTVDEAVKTRRDFLPLSHFSSDEKRRLIRAARSRLRVAVVDRLDETQDKSEAVTWPSPDQPMRKLVTCDLNEMATVYCNGMSIRDELVKCGRQRDQAEAAIRHQKRRRGQSTIIETGRSAKKFVAPMRGRGFVLRAAGMRGHGQTSSTGAAASATGSISSGSGGGAGRLDLFRNRPLNTSRPPSLHVDDFTKLVKDDNIEDLPRSRSYRDGRGFRGGRTIKPGGSRSIVCNVGAPQSGVTLSTAVAGGSLAVPFGLTMNPISQLGVGSSANPTSLLPLGWPSMGRPLFPFDTDSRSGQTRRERTNR